MRKTTFAVLMIALLVFAACGGGSDTAPAAFGDDKGGKGRAARPPANDNFASAESVSRIAFNKAASNMRATLEDAEPRLCAEIDNTVWYRYTPTRDINVTVRAAATFPTVVSAFSGSDIAALTEVGCAATGNDTSLTFGALAGQTYNIQVGSVGRSEGTIDVSMRNANQAQLLLGDPGPLLPGWTEKVLLEDTPVATPAVGPVDADLLTIDGRVSSTDPSMYEINITAAGKPLPTLSMKSRGVLTHPVHLELVQLTAEEIRASVRMFYRFDPRQTSCELGIGGSCVVRLPVDPTNVNWATEEGPTAELILKVDTSFGNIDVNGISPDVDVESPLWVRIPLIGQVSALIP